jgi:hypothetical protein
MICYLDSLSPGLDASFRIMCSDGSTLLGFSQNGVRRKGAVGVHRADDGTYYIRVASYQGLSTGGYRILTTTNFPQNDRARDPSRHLLQVLRRRRHVGTHTAGQRQSGYFDDWLPEVAVDGVGRASSPTTTSVTPPTVAAAGPTSISIARTTAAIHGSPAIA